MPRHEEKPIPAEDHPAIRQLERLMRGDLSRAEAVGLVRHLLTGCPRCAEVARRFWGLGERPPALKALLQEMRALESSAPRWPGPHGRASLY
jgi:hypothetical protein